MLMANVLKKSVAIATLSLLGSLSSVYALTFEPFTEAKFNTLKKSNSAFLIDVRADWCPTCKKQHEILKDYQISNPNSGITVLEVDFDTQKQWVKYFKAPRQSTFALYKGKKQIWFAVAETKSEAIFKQLDAVKVVSK